MYKTLLMQSPDNNAIWKRVKFKCHGTGDCIVVINEYPKSLIRGADAYKILWLVEPWAYIERLEYLSVANLEFFDCIVGSIDVQNVPEKFREKIIVSAPYVPWNLFVSAYQKKVKIKPPRYDMLRLATENKTHGAVCINSNLNELPGHQKRFDIISNLSASGICFDLYGGGKNAVFSQYRGGFDDKYSLLRKYRYVIVFENEISEHYWSEKLTDALLAECLPIYFGSRSAASVFPNGSVIYQDVNDMGAAENVGRIVASEHEYVSRLIVIKEAKKIIMERENFLEKCVDIAQEKIGILAGIDQ